MQSEFVVAVTCILAMAASRVFAGSVLDDYYKAYFRYVKPLHLLQDASSGQQQASACQLPTSQRRGRELSFYLFAYTRDDCQGLLAHFLHWYDACGIDLGSRSQFVVHRTNAEASLATRRLLESHGVQSVEYVEHYSSTLKVERVNAFLETLPNDAWLVYPDVDEFFAFPCSWGGEKLRTTEHVLDNATTLEKEVAIDAPWKRRKDFVGGEMYDRIAADWSLAEVMAPPNSLFKQFPLAYRATSCLMHLRPFKHVLSRVECFKGGFQRFESSHASACYDRTPPTGANKTVRKAFGRRAASMLSTTLVFPHFRFTADATRVAADKRKAYERDSARWRAQHPGSLAATKPRDFVNATPAELTAFSHLVHAATAYKQTALLFSDSSNSTHDADEDRMASFKPEVRLVLDLDCKGDRPGAPDAWYASQTSGRLDDTKRRKFLKALDDGANSERQKFSDRRGAAIASYFRTYYSNVTEPDLRHRIRHYTNPNTLAEENPSASFASTNQKRWRRQKLSKSRGIYYHPI